MELKFYREERRGKALLKLIVLLLLLFLYSFFVARHLAVLIPSRGSECSTVFLSASNSVATTSDAVAGNLLRKEISCGTVAATSVVVLFARRRDLKENLHICGQRVQ